MSDIQKNHQVIYFNEHNAQGYSLNLMRFGFHQFQQTVRIQKLDVYKSLYDNLINNTLEKKIAVEFGFNQLIDCIKITICFENFMKSLMLLNGCVIHKLDKNKFPLLYDDQFNRPIHLSELTMITTWKPNVTIKNLKDGMNNQIEGILKKTIGMKELLTKGYQEKFQISSTVINLCKPYFQYRNNLHLYMSEELIISKNDYKEFTVIIDFLNDHLVRIHNDTMKKQNIDDSYKLHKIKYSA